jgi:hypothetical protein
VTFETVNDCCEELELVGVEELVELLGVDELLVPLGLVLAEADTSIGVPLRRTCWLTCWASSSVEPVSCSSKSRSRDCRAEAASRACILLV